VVTEFPLPDVGEGLAEAEIVRWLVAPGEAVTADQEIVEIETDKALVGITSPVSGTLVRHGAEEGDIVAVGALLAVFDDGRDAEGSATDAPAPTVAADAAPAADAPGGSAAAPRTDGGGAGDGAGAGEGAGGGAGEGTAPGRKPKATPATRKLARSLGVDLSTVQGTGPGGRIVDADVERAAGGAPVPAAPEESVAPPAGGPPEPTRPPSPTAPASPKVEPPHGEDRRVPLRGIRRAVSRTMTQSWTTVPHVNSIHEVDLQALQQLRGQLKEADSPIPVTAFLVKAVARALRQYPVLNAQVSADGEEMILKHRINVGVAVDAPDGLIVPVIEDADVRSVHAIGVELTRLAEQARDRSVPQERLRGGTFTVNNYGPLGGWFGTSLIKPPEVGILSLGPARDRVVPRDGEIVIRPVAVMTLAADHRVADGNEIIGFCIAVREALEAPVRLLVEG
jgi:pyruvate/2-oxoglutarate dehydrogenase complex dihydrolipoamide acyltransferase (E2) component